MWEEKNYSCEAYSLKELGSFWKKNKVYMSNNINLVDSFIFKTTFGGTIAFYW